MISDTHILEEKKLKIKEFTDATNVYNQIINNDFEKINIDYENLVKQFDNIINSEIFKDMIKRYIKKI